MRPLRRSSFLFAFLLFAGLAATAQDAAEPLYVVVDYMKAHDAPAYEEMELSIWQPLHQLLVDDGEILGWGLYWVQYGDRSEYDYVTVRTVRGFDTAMSGGFPEDVDFERFIQRAHPNMTSADLMETLNTREMVRSELWYADPVASIPPQPFTTIQVDYMDVEPGNEEEYLAIERGLWMPIHEHLVADGVSTGWQTYQMIYPLGTMQPYNFGTVSTHAAWQDFDFVEIAAAVHPDITWDEIVERTEASRALVKGQIWTVIASTTPADGMEGN